MHKILIKQSLRVLMVFSLLAVTNQAHAARIFLNGVNIDGVANQSFKNCDVTIKANGDVHIAAKGFKVEAKTETPGEKGSFEKGGPVTQRYFLVSESNSPEHVQYEVDVFINSVWVKRISTDRKQYIEEVSRYLKKGKNTVLLVATKKMGARKSASAGDTLNLIIGVGNMTNDQVIIDKPVVEYQRTAAETENFSDEYVVRGK